MQRKNRNVEERDAVCREVVSEASKLGIPLDSPSMEMLMEAFHRYTEAEHGGVIAGVIPADDVRPGSDFEYSLPGRRIVKPLVRLVKRGSTT
jgi:hypothetical protein